MSFLEKWQLDNNFYVGKVNCDGNDGNILSSAKKFEDFTLFFQINNALVKDFTLVNKV